MLDTDTLDTLNAKERQALAALNATLIERANALVRDLDDAGRAAGLDGDLVLDHITGWLQVTLDYAHRRATWFDAHRHDADEPPLAPLRDRADVFFKPAARTPGLRFERVTIERPDREREHRHTYCLSRLTPASRARLLRCYDHYEWPTRQTTPSGWIGLSTR